MPGLPLKKVLAYLDDVLEPQELRELRERIEQDQELEQVIARIQRLLEDPRTLGETAESDEAISAEQLAQYLEGSLSEEEAAELEQRCLASDALLAEVAACHQLVYGAGTYRPATISPQTYQRMYGVFLAGQARTTAITSAAQQESAPESALSPEERLLLLGLPTLLHGPWSKRLVPLGIIVLLLLALTLSLYFALVRPTSPPEGTTKVMPDVSEATTPPPTAKPTEKPQVKPALVSWDARRSRAVLSWMAWLPMSVGQGGLCLGSLLVPALPDQAWETLPAKASTEEPNKPLVVEPPEFPADVERLPPERLPREIANIFHPVTPPLPGERELGTHAAQGIQETLLWRWFEEIRLAQLVRPQERIRASQRLQVWPGFRATLQLESGVTLELVGNIPELHAEPVLDTCLRLHNPDAGYHVDATLERGWLIITGRKDESVIRLRVAGEVWDMLLPAGQTRVLVSVQWRLQRGQEPPTSQPFLAFYTTQHGVLWRRTLPNEPSTLHSVPALHLVVSDRSLPPRRIDIPGPLQTGPLISPNETLPAWAHAPIKLPAHLVDALASFQRLVTRRMLENPARPFEGARQALKEQLDDPQAPPVGQRLAAYALAMCQYLDELIRLLDMRKEIPVRQAAREALHYWLGQYPQRVSELSQVAKRLGYSEPDAALLVELLRGYSAPHRNVAESLLRIMESNTSVALRYLAVANLRELYPHLRDNYLPDADEQSRAKAVATIRKQLP
ncbi:MAG: hypothetical protein NZ914_09805 [Gemmatales bacterium]|nr:hypothetical protein [Gemmatales bacterium]